MIHAPCCSGPAARPALAAPTPRFLLPTLPPPPLPSLLFASPLFSCGPSAVSQSVRARVWVRSQQQAVRLRGTAVRTNLASRPPNPPPPMNLEAFSSGPSERDSAAVALPILHADVHLQSLQRGGLNAHQTQSVCTDLLVVFSSPFFSLSLSSSPLLFSGSFLRDQ